MGMIRGHIHMCFLFYNNSKMARTKNGVRPRPAGPPNKTTRALPCKKGAPATPRPYRFRPRTRARMEIRKLRFLLPKLLLIPRLPFGRLIREIVQVFMAAPRFQAQAIEALHCAAESHLAKLFEETNLLVHHAKRITVYKFDQKLVRRIRSELE